MMLGRGFSGLAPIWIPLLSSICFFLPLALRDPAVRRARHDLVFVCAHLAGEGPDPGTYKGCSSHTADWGVHTLHRHPGSPPLDLIVQEPSDLSSMYWKLGREGNCCRVSLSSELPWCLTFVLLGWLLGLLFIIYYCSLSADRVGAFVCFVWVSI